MAGRPMERVVVTGGAGFLGSHLCQRLIAQSTAVICIDNLLTGSLENLRDLSRCSHFQFVHWDITQPIDLLTSTVLVPWSGDRW